MRILHISDIQEGKFGIKVDLKLQDKENYFSTYKKILKDLESIFLNIHKENPLDIIIISGDLASEGRSDEYDNLQKEFIPILEKCFLKNSNPIRKKRWIIVPGNHDVLWDEGDKRFNNFITFCKNIGINKEFQLNHPDSIRSIKRIRDSISGKRIDFVILNSCLKIKGENTKDKASISKEYIISVSSDLPTTDIPGIMVCHHRLLSMQDYDSGLRYLNEINNVKLCFCGDYHLNPETENVVDGIRVLTAGSLLSAKSERTHDADEIPRQFNIYNLDFVNNQIEMIKYVYTGISWKKDESIPYPISTPASSINPISSISKKKKKLTQVRNNINIFFTKSKKKILEFTQKTKKIPIKKTINVIFILSFFILFFGALYYRYWDETHNFIRISSSNPWNRDLLTPSIYQDSQLISVKELEPLGYVMNKINLSTSQYLLYQIECNTSISNSILYIFDSSNYEKFAANSETYQPLKISDSSHIFNSLFFIPIINDTYYLITKNPSSSNTINVSIFIKIISKVDLHNDSFDCYYNLNVNQTLFFFLEIKEPFNGIRVDCDWKQKVEIGYLELSQFENFFDNKKYIGEEIENGFLIPLKPGIYIVYISNYENELVNQVHTSFEFNTYNFKNINWLAKNAYWIVVVYYVLFGLIIVGLFCLFTSK